MVESVLRVCAREYSEKVAILRLHGYVHTDDRLAILDIARQLNVSSQQQEIMSRENSSTPVLRPPTLRVALVFIIEVIC